MRAGIVGVLTLFASTALAAELPLQGIYGNEGGCERLRMEIFVPDEQAVNVYADKLVGFKRLCSFEEVWTTADENLFGVQAFCVGEAPPTLEQFIVQLDEEDSTVMTVLSADAEPLHQLALCENILVQQ